MPSELSHTYVNEFYLFEMDYSYSFDDYFVLSMMMMMMNDYVHLNNDYYVIESNDCYCSDLFPILHLVNDIVPIVV